MSCTATPPNDEALEASEDNDDSLQPTASQAEFCFTHVLRWVESCHVTCFKGWQVSSTCIFLIYFAKRPHAVATKCGCNVANCLFLHSFCLVSPLDLMAIEHWWLEESSEVSSLCIPSGPIPQRVADFHRRMSVRETMNVFPRSRS